MYLPAFLSVPRSKLKWRTRLATSRGDPGSGQRNSHMINDIIGDLWLCTRCVCAAIWLISMEPPTVLGQSPASSDASEAASTPPVPKPANPPMPKPAIPPPTTPESSMEDRLRRMEEAYRRIEEANKKIQGQYDGLLKKYEELNGQLKSARGVEPSRGASATTRPASRVGAVEYQEPPARAASEGLGAAGNGRADGAWRPFRIWCGGHRGKGDVSRGRRTAFHGRGGHDPARRGAWRCQPACIDGHRSTGDGGTSLPARDRTRAARKRCCGVSPRSSSPRDWNSHPPTTNSSSLSTT